MKGDAELEALIRAVDADDRLQIELGEALGRFRKRREREIADMQAAQLLPLGAEVVAIRQRCHRSTVYRRARRSRLYKVARQSPDATPA